MKKKAITFATVLTIALAGGLWLYGRADASEASAYRTAPVQRGNLTATVSATGTLGAVRTVLVGTQVSGQIAEIHADFNDKVKKGQLLARIDPTLQKQAVQDAQAGVFRADAQLTQTRLEYERDSTLHEQKIITDPEWNTAVANYAVNKGNLASAQIALDKARQNLAYTNIYSPIDGVVVERDMDVGQTVAASLSAPQLFIIANDLTQMQILATVDESDIGLIKEGQAVTFTVQAYPDQRFDGTVRQVRINATTANNVVNYTAVVSVQNPGSKLLPGMTATVKFQTGTAAGALTVPNAALRFRPAATTAFGTSGGAVGGSTGGSTEVSTGRSTRTGASTEGALYTTDAAGLLTKHLVTRGLSDGQRTVVTGAGIAAGMQVVVGTSQTTAITSPATAANPLQSQTAQRRGGPAGPF